MFKFNLHEYSLFESFPADETELFPSYRKDTRQYSEKEYNKFVKLNTVNDWSQLSWKDIGKPFEVKNLAKSRIEWESENGRSMDPKTSWRFFNESFHEWFQKDVPKEIKAKRKAFLKSLASFKASQVKQTIKELSQIHLWNYAHRIQDGIWDPRGKRALFEGLDVDKPRILFLGAAEGYEGMQLAAMYPEGEVILVDYDEYCKTHRFKDFPESYPFLGSNPQTGFSKVWYKDQMNIEYVISDIRDLPYSKEFDIVLSVGLLEHFPDELKPEVMEWHRKFCKDSGYVIMTTPRAQLRSKLYYEMMADVMNHTYRELMTIEQMGLYVYENGLDIIRHGFLKVHNGIIAKVK